MPNFDLTIWMPYIVSFGVPSVLLGAIAFIRTRLGVGGFYSADLLSVFAAFDLSVVIYTKDFLPVFARQAMETDVKNLSVLMLLSVMMMIMLSLFYEVNFIKKKTVTSIGRQTRAGAIVNFTCAAICIWAHILFFII